VEDLTSPAPPAIEETAGDRGAPWQTIAAAEPPTAHRRQPSVKTVIVRLSAGFVAVLVVVAVLGALAAQWLAEREAVNDAANVTDVLAEAVVQPSLTTGLADGDADAVAEFDRTVRDRILGEDVVRVKLWSPDGVVLYADEPQLIGRTFVLDGAQQEALAEPQTRAAISDLSEEENEFESGSRLLEVYRPVWAPDGRELLFEVYLPYEPVAVRSGELWRGFTGLTTSSLLLLALLTAPIVWGLLVRVRGEERRRATLLQHAVDASDDERRRIAGTLHDGPVQELVASSFAAESGADAAERRGDRQAADELRGVAASVRGNIRVLRSLLVDIYPPGLAAAGLAQAVNDLAATARTRGVDVTVELGDDIDSLSADDQRLIHRVAQEALRNVAKHAAPCDAWIRVETDGPDVVLEVGDDGPGFDQTDAGGVQSGHLGVRVIADLAEQAGAELSLATAPGQGTRWRLRLPRGAADGAAT